MQKEEFKRIFDQFYHPIKNFLYYKLGDVDLAEDITQEVFLKAWQKRDGIVMETVKSLLYTIASNLAVNHFNSARHKYEFGLNHEDKASGESPHYRMEEEEFAEKLRSVIGKLPENQRVVFLMNRIDDLTYREIAQRLDISVKAVEKRMHKALELLKSHIEHKI